MKILALLLLAQEIPVEAPLPAGVDGSKLAAFCDDKEVPCQVAAGRLVLLDGGGRLYALRKGAPKAFPRVEVADVEGKHLDFSFNGKKILRYNYGTIQPPAGVDAVFARSGYLHPIWNPAGKVVTNDFPAKHLHHHGLWFPWTSAEFEGRKSDFWNSKEKQGKVECVKVEETCSGPVFAGFRARHRFVNLNAPEGPKAALDEVWDVRVYALAGRFLFDLVSTQTCATDKPLVIKKYYYGGLGFRGSGEWEGPDAVGFLTSEGRSRKDGNETTGKWCVMMGKVEGQETSIGFLSHPANFRFPQGMRLHPGEPFFNWAPSQGGDFSIEPGKPYVSRYRFIVSDGTLTAAEMDAAWKAYAEPPAPRLVAEK